MFRRIKSDLLSGFATALFSIPEGMAYAKLAGVNPVFGLYSGMVATITASLTTGTVLMISTITSAIAISTHNVMKLAGIDQHDTETALFTLTFLVGLVMFVLGILRLGKLVNYVTNAVMTGFICGASFLILVGELGDLVGYKVTGSDKFEHIVDWISHIGDWEPITCVVGIGSIVMMLLLQHIPKLKEAATILTLLAVTLIVNLIGLKSVALVGSIAHVPSSLPGLSLPDPTLMPKLALGAISIAMVALIQGAGISAVVPNPDGSKSGHSRDFIGEGLGNLAGSFFQSMGTGGSLSRTGVSVGAGSQSRWGGVFVGLWLALVVLIAGHYIEYIPLAAMSGILCVIAIQLIRNRLSDIVLIAKTSIESTIVMGSTFAAALFIPLQWTIFLGAGLSFLFYLYTSMTEVKLVELVKTPEGGYLEKEPPKVLPSGKTTILQFQGNGFFAEIPEIWHLMPSIVGVHDAELIWQIHGVDDLHSGFRLWLNRFKEKFETNGNRFILRAHSK